MPEVQQQLSTMMAVSRAMVALHKEQFGRGATTARSFFAGPDTLVCTLEDVLLPAEHKLVAMGKQEQVRESRTSFQVATRDDFMAAVEQILGRRVRAFASAVDPEVDTVFEVFKFEPGSAADSDGLPADDGLAAELPAV